MIKIFDENITKSYSCKTAKSLWTRKFSRPWSRAENFSHLLSIGDAWRKAVQLGALDDRRQKSIFGSETNVAKPSARADEQRRPVFAAARHRTKLSAGLVGNESV